MSSLFLYIIYVINPPVKNTKSISICFAIGCSKKKPQSEKIVEIWNGGVEIVSVSVYRRFQLILSLDYVYSIRWVFNDNVQSRRRKPIFSSRKGNSRQLLRSLPPNTAIRCMSWRSTSVGSSESPGWYATVFGIRASRRTWLVWKKWRKK